MTTVTYDERLRTFAEGKRLGRLTGVVRNPKDSLCDACGSTLPSTLFGLRDSVGGRDYFVGHNCLAAMLETELVARARYRQGAEKAYRDEMEVRRNGATPEILGTKSKIDTKALASDRRPSPGTPKRTVYIIETESHYQVTTHLTGDSRRVTGRAEEPRWQGRWVRQDGGLVLVEGAQAARPRALTVCVLKAYHEARSLWRNGANHSTEDAGQEVKAC